MGKHYIIATSGDMPYVVVKSPRSPSGLVWRRGEPGRVNAYRFATREEAERQMTRRGGFGGAAGQLAEVIEVDE